MARIICLLFGHKQPLIEQQFARPVLFMAGRAIKLNAIIPKFKDGHKWWICTRCHKRIFK